MTGIYMMYTIDITRRRQEYRIRFVLAKPKGTTSTPTHAFN